MTIIFTRQTISGKLSLPKFKTDCYKYGPIVSSISAWNRLDNEIREASSIDSFNQLFKRSWKKDVIDIILYMPINNR